MSWLRLARTLLPLRISQIVWRLRYLLRRRWEECPVARIEERTARRTPRSLAVQPEVTVPPLDVSMRSPADLLDELQSRLLTLLNEQRPFRGGGDWCMIGGRASHRLWLYTLHDHGWLGELASGFAASGQSAYADCLGEYLADWLRVCRPGLPGFAHYAWNSHSLATRLGNWYHIYHTLPSSFWTERHELHGEFLKSMAVQAAYLANHLEWDLRGNHLLRDATGLAWGGRFFAEGGEWLKTATRLAVQQTEEQILPDGGHFERSPLYHLHVMEDVLTLALLLDDPQARNYLRDSWRRMADFLVWLRHPDGDLALFNDGGLLGAQAVERMLAAGEHLDVTIDTTPRRGGVFFPDTGLVVWHREPWSIFFDVGPLGPNCQAGHGHADTLTVECSFQGRRLFVDPGTFAYDRDENRRYDRSTAAHNTVCVDGQDSSEVWHIFRVGRRAVPRDVDIAFTASEWRATASHTGYDHLPGQPRPTRRLDLKADGRLIITDTIAGRRHHRLDGGFLLAPGWTATPAAEGWNLTNEESRVRVTVRGTQVLQWYEERRPYHPEYGRALECTRLSWHLEGDLPAEIVTVAERA